MTLRNLQVKNISAFFRDFPTRLRIFTAYERRKALHRTLYPINSVGHPECLHLLSVDALRYACAPRTGTAFRRQDGDTHRPLVAAMMMAYKDLQNSPGPQPVGGKRGPVCRQASKGELGHHARQR